MAIPLTIVAMNFRAPLQIFYAQTRCQKGAAQSDRGLEM
jgi:hypothetical protein